MYLLHQWSQIKISQVNTYLAKTAYLAAVNNSTVSETVMNIIRLYEINYYDVCYMNIDIAVHCFKTFFFTSGFNVKCCIYHLFLKAVNLVGHALKNTNWSTVTQ